jgi:uncharacterized protein
MIYYVYRDSAREWRWQLKASNGRILADSGEGYKNKADCRHYLSVVATSGNAEVREV